ncbi:MAG: hypothetical protein JJE17_08445 [Peptostreptococcaceae bacterium]|nr:hypothetical protein [Peptostreptococcaceae bacterium]
MNIKIHRGENQIGGNIIEIASETTKIVLDAGLELNGKPGDHFDLPGLFQFKGYDAIFLSHYHSDHIGLVYQIHPDIPVYMGESSYKIVSASDKYKGVKTFRVEGFMGHKQPIQIGDMIVTPFLCDHSAFDSYMILVESGNEKVLYTGDFRSNGRKPADWLMEQLPAKIDILISEGTSLSRVNRKNITEKELEEKAVDLFKNAEGPIFVLQSSMNIDRIVTMYRAGKRAGRLMLQDLYLAEITGSIGMSIPNPTGFSDAKVFITKYYPPFHLRYRLFSKYGAKKISKTQISKTNFLMCVRASMLNYIVSLSKKMSFEGGILVYSFWSGYKEEQGMKAFLAKCESLGLKVITLHTSGHADHDTIRALIAHTNPDRIIPVHTENAAWFDEFQLGPGGAL